MSHGLFNSTISIYTPFVQSFYIYMAIKSKYESRKIATDVADSILKYSKISHEV